MLLLSNPRKDRGSRSNIEFLTGRGETGRPCTQAHEAGEGRERERKEAKKIKISRVKYLVGDRDREKTRLARAHDALKR